MSARVSSVSDQIISIEDFSEAPIVRVSPKALITAEERMLFQWIGYGVLLLLVSVFGIVTNIMNICCFLKQGLNESVNVSLLGLALSDLGCLITSLGTSIGFNPAVYLSDIPVETALFSYLVFGWPHMICVRLTSCITALITLERCVCMTMPLKVKSIITPKRVTSIIICIFISLCACVSPVFYVNRLAVAFVPERNRTMLTTVYTDNKDSVENVLFLINHAIIPFSTYLMIIVCTAILVVTLRKKSKWRRTVTRRVDSDNTSKRDQKVAKMAVVISVLFIACFTPFCLIFISMMLVPELAVDGAYVNMLSILAGLSLLLESANSAVNIFIYYHMSSRYKAMFRTLFLKRKTS